MTFEGIDRDMLGEPYSASLPLAEALDPAADIVLAHSMADEPLPRDHGFPLRAIVPGMIGVSAEPPPLNPSTLPALSPPACASSLPRLTGRPAR